MKAQVEQEARVQGEEAENRRQAAGLPKLTEEERGEQERIKRMGAGERTKLLLGEVDRVIKAYGRTISGEYAEGDRAVERGREEGRLGEGQLGEGRQDDVGLGNEEQWEGGQGDGGAEELGEIFEADAFL